MASVNSKKYRKYVCYLFHFTVTRIVWLWLVLAARELVRHVPEINVSFLWSDLPSANNHIDRRHIT